MPTNCAEGVAGLIDGKIYVTSATDGNARSWPKSLYVYDPKPNSWKRLADSAIRHGRGAAGVIAGKLYVAGGFVINEWTNTLEVYDPLSNTWTTKAPMPTPRSGCAGAVIANKLYVVGGYDGSNYLRTMESYDPVTDQWMNEPPMPTARESCGAAVIDGMLYVVGGCTNSSLGQTDAIEMWAPSRQWTVQHPIGPMWQPVSHALVTAIGRVIYVAGGATGRGATAECQSYSPDRNMWQLLARLPEVRDSGCAQVLNGELYVFGGWDDLPGVSQLPHPDVFIYNRDLNKWRRSAPAMVAR